MSGFCKCGDGQENLGVLGCPRLLSSVKKHIRVPLFDSQGKRNSILLSDFSDGQLTDVYLKAKFNEVDPTKRWYLTPKTYKNVEPSRTDSSYEDFSDGSRSKVDTGVKEFAGIITEIDGQVAGKMNKGACSLFGHYEVDTASSIKGEMSIDGLELFPIQVAQGSFEAVEIEPVEGSSVQRISITFQYAKTVNESQLRIINSENIDVNLLQINGALGGLLDGTGTPSATSFDASFYIECFGYFGEVIGIEGQTLPADWEITDSGLGSVVPTLITEVDGVYTFTIPSTPAETLTVKFIGVPASSLDQVYESNTITVTTP
tara:strand:+ start:6783 stop:7733 length:951 start_codon:yes stop_codon:yes gene_type:complete